MTLPMVCRQKDVGALDVEILLSVLESIEVPKHREVLVIMDDFTRPTTITHRMLLNVVRAKMNFEDDRLSVLFANGMHRAMSFQEIEQKIGKVLAKACRVYQHNPCANFSPFMKMPDDYYRIVLGTVMPHSYMGISGGAKMVIPGLSSYRAASNFHGSREYAGQAHSQFYDRSEFIDVMVQQVLNINGSPIFIHAGRNSDGNRAMLFEVCLNYCYVDLPKEVDVAILEPRFKCTDFLQSINALTVLQGYNPVKKGGVIAIRSSCLDGIGVHYLLDHHDSWIDQGIYEVRVKAQDEHGAESGWSTILFVAISGGNDAPIKPTQPEGESSGKTGVSYTYST